MYKKITTLLTMVTLFALLLAACDRYVESRDPVRSLPEPLHEFACTIRLLGSQEEMNMICHQDIGMNGTLCQLCVFCEPVKIYQKIFIVKKTRLPVVSTLDDMNRDIWQDDTRASWHI